jgi:hypothetical protein
MNSAFISGACFPLLGYITISAWILIEKKERKKVLKFPPHQIS